MGLPAIMFDKQLLYITSGIGLTTWIYRISSTSMNRVSRSETSWNFYLNYEMHYVVMRNPTKDSMS